MAPICANEAVTHTQGGVWHRFRHPQSHDPRLVRGKIRAPGMERIDTLPQEIWRSYLDWYRDVLDLVVENEVELTLIEPAGDLLLAHLRQSDRIERVHARKIVLATGFDGSGSWRAPQSLVAHLPAELYAHSADDIDFRKLAGKRVGVLGVGASAFDNAASALEAGAARVDVCFRRSEMPRVNPLTWMNFAGMLGHFEELTDLERWRFMRRILGELPVPPTQDGYWRCRKYENFAWHANCGWRSVREASGGAKVQANRRGFEFDFIIFATGVETDLSARSGWLRSLTRLPFGVTASGHRPAKKAICSHVIPIWVSFEFTERHPGMLRF